MRAFLEAVLVCRHFSLISITVVAFAIGAPRDAAALATPADPVVFIHGLASDRDAWKWMEQFLIANGWDFGGVPKTTEAPGPVFDARFPGDKIGAGDFYVLEFSDSMELTLEEQARQLDLIIKEILVVNPGHLKVSLVGHSMGGLAARRYLQFIGITGADVGTLITVGTPHQGTEIAVWCQELRLFCNLFSDVDPSSIGLNELRPDSQALFDLYDVFRNPLPTSVTYTSIIGTGGSTFIVGAGDGAVSEASQNLGIFAGSGRLQHRSETFIIEKCDADGDGDEDSAHSCEKGDPWVRGSILAGLGVTVDLDIVRNQGSCVSPCTLNEGDSVHFLVVNQEGSIFGDALFVLKRPDSSFIVVTQNNASFREDFALGIGGEIVNAAPGFYSVLLIIKAPGESWSNQSNWRHIGSASFKVNSP